MARHGISYYDIANAAQQLVAEGRNPTIEAIRAMTGTGSSSTIAQHLRTWKAKQDQNRELLNKDNLPEEIIALVRGLWERVMGQAEDQVTAIRDKLENELSELQQQKTTLETDNRLWETKHQKLLVERDALASDKIGLEQLLIELQKQTAVLQSKLTTLDQQLLERQNRVEELNRLNQQVQANLEHFREATREQRLLDHARHEQEQQQLKAQIQELKQNLKEINHQQASLLKKHEQLSQEKDQIFIQHEKLSGQFESLRLEAAGLEKALTKAEQIQHHWQDRCQTLQAKVEESSQLTVELASEKALMTQQLSYSQQQLQELQDKYQFQAREKWELAQEKAQLEGQLKQLQSIMTHREKVNI